MGSARRAHPVVALFLAMVMVAGACGGTNDAADPDGDRAPLDGRSADDTTVSSPEPTSRDVSAPTTTLRVDPIAPPLSEADWTSYTIADGLPGNDIVSVDVHADGTTWVLAALERDDRGRPAALGFARYDAEGWTAVEGPLSLDGTPRLRAGPDGSAWLIGAQAWAECGSSNVDLGPSGLWHFDGTVWKQISEVGAEQGSRLVYDGMVDPNGTLWTVGYSSISEVYTSSDPPSLLGPLAVSSYDAGTWTDVAINEFSVGFDCQQLFLDGSGTVWLDWDDFRPGKQAADPVEWVAVHARLDGSVWVEFDNTFTAAVGDPSVSLAPATVRAVGVDGTYMQLTVGDVRALESGVSLPDVGEVKPIAGIFFDGEQWTEPFAAEIAVGEGHTITPFVDPVVPGAVNATAVMVEGSMYLTGFGGVIRIDRSGEVVVLGVDDGLVSNATRHISATTEGVLWVATDSGVSRLALSKR